MFWLVFGFIGTIATLCFCIKGWRKEIQKYDKSPIDDPLIVEIWESSKDNWTPEKSLVRLFYGTAILILITIFNIGSIVYWQNWDDIKRFENYQEMVESTVSDRDEVNFAMNEKILEYNEWLSDSKMMKERYGMFSPVPRGIKDLNYIRIEEENHE